MQIVEAKNNLVKISYINSQESLTLSGFVVIKDPAQSFIGQVVHLEASTSGNFAIIKLLFNFDDNGVITSYNGSVPDPSALLDVVYPQELLELLPVHNPIVVGELAQQKTILTLDRALLEKHLLVCAEKEEDSELLINNLVKQLSDNGKKTFVIDLVGNPNLFGKRLVVGQGFKLPLNYESINFIYEKDLDDSNAETKALIQDIFLEVQNYVKTLPDKFIPFESFKEVVDSQYEETDFVELVLLKNKLLKYYDEGIFAQRKDEFESLKTVLNSSGNVILDASHIDENIQREVISYVYSLIETMDQDIYLFCSINDNNSDKKLLKKIFSNKNAFSSIICPYGYKYLKEIKQLSKDLILFSPIQQQNDFAGYNVFLGKLNPHEFVIYGQATHYLPLIVRLDDISRLADITPPLEEVSEPPTKEELLDEEIKRDVDEIFIAPKVVSPPELPEDDDTQLTEDDLDLIDDLVYDEDSEDVGDQIYLEPQVPDLVDEYLIDEQIIVDSQKENTEDKELELKDETIFEAPREIEELSLEENLNEDVQLGTGYDAQDQQPQFEVEPDYLDEIPEVTNQEPQALAFAEQEEQQESFSDVLQQQSQEPPAVDILPARMSSTPIVPVYPADVESNIEPDEFEQGDIVTHPKYGKGTVEKLINYGSKTLCSINFDNVGRRLLDPSLAEIKKI